jgi:hypothetical protein
MSESLAAFRSNRSNDLRQLAEEHVQHDLNQQDRDLLKSAGGKVSMHAGVASLIGVGLGVYAAFRLRAMRLAYFNAFKAMEKPVEVRFADGRTGIIILPCWSCGGVLITSTRTYSRYLSKTFAVSMGRCRNIFPLLCWRPFPGRRDRLAHRHRISISDDYKGSREQRED